VSRIHIGVDTARHDPAASDGFNLRPQIGLDGGQQLLNITLDEWWLVTYSRKASL
jgi:hypothetical protein